MSFGKTIPLANGALIPQLGLGTWLSKPKEVEFAVECAVRNGYRHLDLAMIYENQHEVGAALKKLIPSVIKREDLFITSKLWNSSHKPELVEKELDETLSLLGLEYLDLYLIHWPVAFTPGDGLWPKDPVTQRVSLDTETSLVETWKAMIKLPKSKVRAIGVSNFTIEHIEGIIKATNVVPIVSQVELHPLLPQDDLIKYCKEKNIHVTAYSPLGNNLAGYAKLTDHPTVQEVAKRVNATPAQVLIAWGAARGQSIIPKSVQEDRIISNFKQIELSEEDVVEISKVGVGNHKRYNAPFTYLGNASWDINIFNEAGELAATNRPKVQ